jgi:hypothetical protein
MVCRITHAGDASFFILVPPFDLNNPRSILKDDCVAGCQIRWDEFGAKGVVLSNHGGHQTPVRHHF